MCREDQDVDDVLQETYIAIVRNLPSFRSDASFLTWVYTILRTHRGRSARTARRERGRREVLRQIGDLSPTFSGVDRAVESRQLLAAFGTAMSEIGELDRDVAFLRDVEGLTAAEVSVELGLSVPAVKSRLHRARSALRTHMEPLVAA